MSILSRIAKKTDTPSKLYRGLHPLVPIMPSYWFGDVENGECAPVEYDPEALAARLASLKTNMGAFTPLDWTTAVKCGVARDRPEYLAKVQAVCIAAAEAQIRETYSGKDAELLQMVRMLDELDSVINLLSERAADWYQVRRPTFSRKYRRVAAHNLVRTLKEKNRGPLGKVAGHIDELSKARTDLAREVSNRATRTLPNVSALIGGLVAARLMAQAGGLLPLARLPASAIQILGARTALFAHLRTQSPSPKHGVIFQHRRVHNAPKPVRGKVSRVLAGKLAIAARIDYYRGEADPEFLESAQRAIDAATGVKHDAVD